MVRADHLVPECSSACKAEVVVRSPCSTRNGVVHLRTRSIRASPRSRPTVA